MIVCESTTVLIQLFFFILLNVMSALLDHLTPNVYVSRKHFIVDSGSNRSMYYDNDLDKHVFCCVAEKMGVD